MAMSEAPRAANPRRKTHSHVTAWCLIFNSFSLPSFSPSFLLAIPLLFFSSPHIALSLSGPLTYQCLIRIVIPPSSYPHLRFSLFFSLAQSVLASLISILPSPPRVPLLSIAFPPFLPRFPPPILPSVSLPSSPFLISSPPRRRHRPVSHRILSGS